MQDVTKILRRQLESLATVSVIAKLSKCGQRRTSAASHMEGKLALQDMTIFTVMISEYFYLIVA